MTNYNPNIDPANNGTLVGTIGFAYQQMIKNTDGMLPAKVLSYDIDTNRVSVQLLISLVTTDGTQIPRPSIASIPVLIMGGGGFTLNFPVNAGDLGWVMANDRDISLFLQTYAQAQPNTGRVKNFSDGIFIPDVMKTYDVTTSQPGYVTLASVDGKVSVTMGLVEQVDPAPNYYEATITGDRININLNDPLTGVLVVDGNIAVSGSIVAEGAITPLTPIVPFPPPYIP